MIFARKRLAARSACSKDRLELLRRDHLELCVGARARVFVRSPAAELRRVSEARALHVVVADLGDELRAQRLPREVLPLAPAALAARHALAIVCRGPPSFGFGSLRVGRVPPV